MDLDQGGCGDGWEERVAEKCCRVSAGVPEKGYRDHRCFERAYFDNVLKMQGMPPEALREAQNEDAKDIRSAKLQPLAAPNDLLAESYLNGRLYVVMDKNHNAPVMLQSPDAPGLAWGKGEYWSRIGGKWYVVKRPE